MSFIRSYFTFPALSLCAVKNDSLKIIRYSLLVTVTLTFHGTFCVFVLLFNIYNALLDTW